MLGLIEASELESLRDEHGTTIGEAMNSVGLPPEKFKDAVRDDLDAFVELHIEQGRILFDEGLPLGIVDAITGIYRFRVTVEGRTDHAGAWNIVPGLVNFSVDLRHPDETTKQRLAAQVRQRGEEIAAEHGVGVSYEVVSDVLPKELDAQIKAHLQAAADARGVKWIPMVSGAGHDSQVMATRVPTAMLFVPSVEGRSHSAAEFTSPEDAARGATVLARALRRLAY
jgi:allantoate deiminase